MAFSVLNSLALAFMVAGVTLLVTAWGLARRARRYQRGMQALLALSHSEQDALDLPPAAWPALQSAGWRGLIWHGDWFGQAVRGQLGQAFAIDQAPAHGVQAFTVAAGSDAHLQVHLLHTLVGGEQRLFAQHLAQVFVLLMETRLRERTAALSAALAQRAQLSLYLQHDARNLAQWMVWVGTDFRHADSPDALLHLARRLQGNAPLVVERAQRLMAAMVRDPAPHRPRTIALAPALAQAAQLAGVELPISGDANAWIPSALLQRALDNLLGNLAAGWREGNTEPPTAHISTPPCTGLTRVCIELRCALPPSGLGLAAERLFEPFASGRPGGLGLGLYQARLCLRQADGDLRATVSGQQVCFTLWMPEAQEATEPAPSEFAAV